MIFYVRPEIQIHKVLLLHLSTLCCKKNGSYLIHTFYFIFLQIFQVKVMMKTVKMIAKKVADWITLPLQKMSTMWMMIVQPMIQPLVCFNYSLLLSICFKTWNFYALAQKFLISWPFYNFSTLFKILKVCMNYEVKWLF